MSDKRTKFNVEYPIAKTINEAIAWMESGGEVWQECSEDFPNCMGFDDVDCLMENFPHEDYEYGDNIQDYYLHLCPTDRDDDYAEPFKVGETIWASEQFFMTNDVYMHKGDSHKITEISPAGGSVRLDCPKDEWKQVWWPADKFCRCVLPVNEKKVYVLGVIDIDSAPNLDNIYQDLDFLKQESDSNILWSDEHEDFENILEEHGVLNEYSGSNWDIEGISKETGKLCYGVNVSSLRTQYS